MLYGLMTLPGLMSLFIINKLEGGLMKIMEV